MPIITKKWNQQKAEEKSRQEEKYQGEVIEVLEQIGEICNRICLKRLHPFLPEIIEVLERLGELDLSEATKTLLLSMSRATIDRCLKPARYDHKKGLSTTKPGTLLKQSIEVRTWQDWDDEQPSFMEIDLVAHCGDTLAGQYLFTLTTVDIATGWTECLALPNKTQWAVHEAIQEMRKRLPFPLLGIECTRRLDNRTQRRLKMAAFPIRATIEYLDLSPERGLERRLILELAQCHWVEQPVVPAIAFDIYRQHVFSIPSTWREKMVHIFSCFKACQRWTF